MDIINLIIMFTGIIIVIKLKKPLYISILVGSIISAILYKIPIQTVLKLVFKACSSKNTIYLILAFYTLTFLQKMMENRGHLLLAEKSLNSISNNKRLNIMIAPFIIGLLPSVGAVIIAAPIVKGFGGDYLDIEEQAFVTSYYRHISEAFLPTYSSIILALSLSEVNMLHFVLGMLPMIIVLFFLGYVFYIKKIPRNIDFHSSQNKKNDIYNLIISLWPIAAVIIIIMTIQIPVYIVVIFIIIISGVLNRFRISELTPLLKTSFELKLVLNTMTIMIFKEFITFTKLIERFPIYFEKLSINPIIIFSLIFLFGTLVAGSQAMIALAFPLAFMSIPNGGLALMILLMCMMYIARQISPTHICLSIVIEVFGISFLALVKKTLPILAIFSIVVFLYTYLLFTIL